MAVAPRLLDDGGNAPLAERRRAYFEERQSQLESLAIARGDTVLVGDSLTERGEWAELLGDARIKNRGIGGDTAEGVLARIPAIAKAEPAVIGLMVGVNDLQAGRSPASVLATYERILDAIASEAPATRVVVQSVLPVHPLPSAEGISNAAIGELNDGLRALCERRGLRYVDVATALAGPGGALEARFTRDGVHLDGAGYAAWRDALRPALSPPAPK